MPVGVRIYGLREMTKSVVAAELMEPAALRASLKTVATSFVEWARPRLESQIMHHDRSTGRLEASLRAASTLNSASVILGTPVRIPYAGWWEYGGPRDKKKAPPRREYKKEGRVLYPTFVAHQSEIEAEVFRVMDEMLQVMMR